MPLEGILDLDIASLSGHLRRRKVSAVEVAHAYIDRIGRIDGTLGAYIVVTSDHALAAAKRADLEIRAGNWRGPLQGVPVGLKDNLCTAGIRTTAGSKVLADFVPDIDATAWARLSAQGAVLLGKLNLNEFAYGGLLKTCRNPYALDRLPGGSSAGAGVAIAARTALATLGTDTSGSIRIPAAMCGCVGFKPTWSRVSRYGVIPLAYTQDHVGPITRTVRDAALMMNVIAGHDANDSTSSSEPVPDFTNPLEAGVKGTNLGVIREFMDGLSDEVAGGFRAATRSLGALGATIDEVSIPSLPAASLVSATITWVEALEYHEPWLCERTGDYGTECRIQLETGMMIPAIDYLRAQRARARILADVLSAMESYDALISPATATTATRMRDQLRMDPKTAAESGYPNMLRFTLPFDCTGQPALSMPMGLADDGLPTSLQIVGRPFEEETVLRVGAAYELARGPLRPPEI